MKQSEWWIDVNEWIAEEGQSGMAFNRAALDEMEMSDAKLIHVIEYSAYDGARQKRDSAIDALRQLADFTESLCEDIKVSKHYPTMEKARAVLRQNDEDTIDYAAAEEDSRTILDSSLEDRKEK